jgi:hypothetical protein
MLVLTRLKGGGLVCIEHAHATEVCERKIVLITSFEGM